MKHWELGWAAFHNVASMKFFAVCLISGIAWSQSPLGIFDGSGDIGTVLHPGLATVQGSHYSITASGENLWGTADAFHFVWKKMSGDVALSAEIAFPIKGGDPHKKAVLMIRQSLTADSAYADIALHGDGLTSLQARDVKSGATHEIQANVVAPRQLRIEKRGDYFYMYLHGFAGGSMRVAMQAPFYVGIGVSAHNKDAMEKAVFSGITLTPAAAYQKTPVAYSTLETITVRSTDRRVSLVSSEPVASPNWTPDGSSLLFSKGGKLHTVAVAGGEPAPLEIGPVRAAGYQGFSPDGTLLALSGSMENDAPAIYVVSAKGGVPKKITANSPSWFHGWSPDGSRLLFTGKRQGRTDLYTIALDGGEETQLTKDKGVNDGGEYSPDGHFLYFHSDRTGTMQVWRMMADGTGEEQLTADEWNNSSPHVSPDGSRLVFLSSSKENPGTGGKSEIILRNMALGDNNKITVLAKLTGGRGTIDAPSWSPDSRRFAFVSYQMVP